MAWALKTLEYRQQSLALVCAISWSNCRRVFLYWKVSAATIISDQMKETKTKRKTVAVQYITIYSSLKRSRGRRMRCCRYLIGIQTRWVDSRQQRGKNELPIYNAKTMKPLHSRYYSHFSNTSGWYSRIWIKTEIGIGVENWIWIEIWTGIDVVDVPPEVCFLTRRGVCLPAWYKSRELKLKLAQTRNFSRLESHSRPNTATFNTSIPTAR